MKIKIINTTDHNYIGSIINYDDIIDDLFINDDIKVELIDVIHDGSNIRLISMNYIIDGVIVEE